MGTACQLKPSLVSRHWSHFRDTSHFSLPPTPSVPHNCKGNESPKNHCRTEADGKGGEWVARTFVVQSRNPSGAVAPYFKAISFFNLHFPPAWLIASRLPHPGRFHSEVLEAPWHVPVSRFRDTSHFLCNRDLEVLFKHTSTT